MTLEITPSNIKINNRQGGTKFDNSNKILFHKYVQQGTLTVGDTSYVGSDGSAVYGENITIPVLAPNDFHTLDITFTAHSPRASSEDGGNTNLVYELFGKTFACQAPIPVWFNYYTNSSMNPPMVVCDTTYLFFGVVSGVLKADMYIKGISGSPSKSRFVFKGDVTSDSVTFNYSYRVYTHG
jgi:hypothetical protein